MDIVSKKTRSRMMSGIKSKNTKPERIVRSALHKRGFRFKLHDKKLPGKPDLVLPKYGAAIFVHGCFWHGHDCHLFKWPSTRIDFWTNKILSNIKKDARVAEDLTNLNWRFLVVWECVLKGKTKKPLVDTVDEIERWITSDNIYNAITGKM